MDPEFNWVKAIGDCSLAPVFERLRHQVKADVEERNSQLKPADSWVFEFASEAASFSIDLSGVPAGRLRGARVISFELRENSIAVTSDGSRKLFDATLTVNDAGECRLCIGAKECTDWQFRRAALENIFFRPLL
jgi:hypothetical protein